MTYVYARKLATATTTQVLLTNTCVNVARHSYEMAEKRAGRVENFTQAQNEALREALCAYHDKQPKPMQSGEEIGKVIGVGQQAASKLMRAGGFGYNSAERVAELAGFEHLKDFFRAKGVASKDTRQPAWARRDMATAAARRAGFRESAILATIDRYAEWEFDSRPPKWWEERIRIAHEDEIEKEGVAAQAEAARKLRPHAEALVARETPKKNPSVPPRRKKTA